jgi:hypothetical protein
VRDRHRERSATHTPGLAAGAYASLVGNLEYMFVFMLGYKPETSRLSVERRTALAGQFLDSLLGSQMLGVLMGLPSPSTHKQVKRGASVADALIAALG